MSDVHPSNGGPSAFPRTRWTLVSMARGDDQTAAQEALEDLCRVYWRPLYGFARRRGLSPDDAEDAVQAFFLKMLELDSLHAADRERGRLRSFLLGALTRFLAQQWRNDHALKRGGNIRRIPIDQARAEEQFELRPSPGAEEDAFDREWAYALLERVFERLEGFHAARGREQVFERLKGCLLGDGCYGDESTLASELGLSGAGVRSAVFQMRQRFRRYIEEEIRDTVGSEADLRDELAHLCRILANHHG